MTSGNPNCEPHPEQIREQIREVLRLRHSAYRFLVGHARFWFAEMEDLTGPMLIPPSLPAAAGSGPIERLEALAADEAERLRTAEPFALDPGATAAAVSYGARLQASAMAQSLLAEPLPAETIAGHGIVPPAPAGFLRWATPIRRPGGRTPVTAVHWGRITTPETSGIWVVLWSDTSAFLVKGLADASAPAWFTPQLARDTLTEHGPISYDDASFLHHLDGGPHTARTAADPAPAVFPFTLLRSLPPAPPPADRPDADGNTAVIYTVLASWAMATPDPAQPARPPHLARLAAPAHQADTDQRAGLPPAGQVTLVTAPALGSSDPLPEGVDEDLRQLMLRIVAMGEPNAPDGPSPDDVIADLLGRYEPEVLMMAAYQDGLHLLDVLTKKTQLSAAKVLAQVMDYFPDDQEMPFDNRAWPALRRLLRVRGGEPTLPPPGIAPADLLWAVGTFQALAFIRLIETKHAGNRPNRSKRKKPTRPSTARKSRKKRR